MDESSDREETYSHEAASPASHDTSAPAEVTFYTVKFVGVPHNSSVILKSYATF